MSVQVKILYGREYDRCKTSSLSANNLKNLDLAMLSEIVWDTVGSYYRDGRDAKSLRIQYRDDEGTFVTITSEDDVQDAVHSCKPVLQGDYEMVRLCLRVDDAWTPLGMKNTKPVEKPREKGVATSGDARKRLFDHDQKKETTCSSGESPIAESPYQRYVKKVKGDIEAKKSELYELESKEQEVQKKILRVKSNPLDGNLCRKCHMRLGHTARLCEYEKCSSVFSCGEEKFHHGELDSRATRNSIKKIKDDIAKLEKDLKLKEEQSEKLSESLSNKIENALMKENGGHYIDAGVKKWTLLRKHVYIIEKHCKKHFGGRIPPKHKLSDILEVAIDQEDDLDESKASLNVSQVKTKRTNPAKVILQDQGISFPDPSEQCTFTSHSSSVYRCAPSNKQEETEQLNMVLKHSLLESNPTAQQEQQSFFTPPGNVMIPVYRNSTPYLVNSSAPAYTFQNDYYGNMNPYFHPSNFNACPPTVQQPVFHQFDAYRAHYSNLAESSCETIAAPNTILPPGPDDDTTVLQASADTRDVASQLMFLSKRHEEWPANPK